MRRYLPFTLTMLAACAALAASAILLVDYLNPAPVFCDPNGGCETVKRTVFAYPLGIPLPALGILGLAGIAVVAMLPGRRATLAQLGLSGAAGIVALGLLGVQARLGVLCPFCAIVDGASVVLAILAVVRWKTNADPPRSTMVSTGAVAAMTASVIVPAIIGQTRPPRPIVATVGVPAPIAEEIARSPKGVLTVVDFVDFECPFCRRMDAELEPLLEARKDRIRLVRKHVPLSMHPHAMDAARAGCCGETLGKGDAMAEKLFTAPEAQLTPEGCEKIAGDLGLDVARYRACIADPATDARIASDKALWRSANGRGLPTLWIGTTELVGAKPVDVVAAALDKEMQAL